MSDGGEGGQLHLGVDRTAKIGVVGTGYIARHFLWALEAHAGFEPAAVLTRRPLQTLGDFEYKAIATNEPERLVEESDLIVEMSGDPVYATDVVALAAEANRPVVTMDAEFQTTTASWFIARGATVIEAEGDQPGSMALLDEEARLMGFTPLVYGNMKGFLNLDPTPEEMAYWAERQEFSVPLTTSATDGTKVNIEQALVANGLGATILEQGMLGPECEDLRAGGELLAQRALELGQPIADYVLSSKNSHGVFLMATHEERHATALRTYKLGEGPFYLLIRPDLTAYLEIMKTVRRVLDGVPLVFNNGAQPRVSVAAIAKKPVPAGTEVATAIGSFEFRGEAVLIREVPGHAPIGLIQGAVTRRAIEAGAIVMMDDLGLPESRALQLWTEIERGVLAAPTVDTVPR